MFALKAPSAREEVDLTLYAENADTHGLALGRLRVRPQQNP